MSPKPESEMIHFQPEVAFTPATPESRELEERSEVEFVVDSQVGTIAKIGDPRDVRQWLTAEKTRRPDLQVSMEGGGVALPGLTDAHQHPLIYGTLEVVGAGYAFGVESDKTMVDLVRREAKDGDSKVPKLIIGHNTATAPNVWRSDLDEASPVRPVCLCDASFHGSRLNTPMLALVAERARAEEESGRHLTGYLDEKTGQATEGYALLAMQIAESYHGIEKIAEGTAEKLNTWIGQGITDVHEMFPLAWDDFTALLLARRNWPKEKGQEFPVRQVFMTQHLLERLFSAQRELERAGLFDPERDWGMVGLKLLADGSFGSHTAMMEAPYMDSGGQGIEYHSADELNRALDLAREHGLENIAMHGIGDAGIRRAVETAKKWREMAEKAKLDPTKFRIEHFELPQSQLQEVARLGVWVNSDPNFLTDFVYEDRLGKRVTQLCPHADILNAGIPMNFGSDGMPTSALFGLWAATHHPVPEQRLSFSQALAAYSLAGADYERNAGRGRLAAGMSADIIMLKRQTLNELLPGPATPDEFKDLARNAQLLGDKVSRLEAGIARIYRQGQLVK